MSRPAVQHPASANLISGTEPQPRAERCGITPPAHIQSNLRNDDQHAEHVQTKDFGQVDPTDALELCGEISLQTDTSFLPMKALLLCLGLGRLFGFRIFGDWTGG